MMIDTYQEIKAEFASYLSMPQWDWTWYATQTFDVNKLANKKFYDRLHEHSWRFFLNRVGQTSPLSYGFCFAESHKSGKMHWHALVHVSENLLGQPRRKDIWSHMFRKYGYNQILPYRSIGVELAIDSVSTGVARYLTKYLVKESARGEAWWEFNGNMGGNEADAGQIMSAIGMPKNGNQTPSRGN